MMLPWLLLLAASLHIVEEFAWPGGFGDWYRRYRPDLAASITSKFLFRINALLLLVCLGAGVLGVGRQGAALWLTLAALLGSNGIFHIQATVRGHAYSPGVITGTALYLPLLIGGYWYFVTRGLASGPTAMVALALGCAYPWISLRSHLRRARAAKA
jgi:hypothetical protein